MNRAVLLIDMPNECMECPLRYKDGDTDDWFRFRCHISDDQVAKGERLENCPLKPMPNKKDVDEELAWDMFANMHDIQMLDVGYNRCIDDILGETE